MESKIVDDFQNLQVFAAYDFFKMDELVHDLTNALEESARCKSKGRSSECSKKMKRRCKRRKAHSNPMVAWELGNMSEASESSIDEAIKDYMENMAQQSDSDDLLACTHGIPSLAALASNPMLSLAESDSVNENFSPMRPHRRRRRYKRMAVDPQNPRQMQELLDAYGISERHVCPDQMFGASQADPMSIASTSEGQTMAAGTLLGKRKRGMKDRGSNSFEVDSLPDDGSSQNNSVEGSSQNMDSNCVSESGTSSLSSNESDGLHTNDESRDGDDEQSDFFHEAGPVCGIVPWWESHGEAGSTSRQHTPSFESIFKGSFEHMSSSARRNYQARLMMAPPARLYRSGRRRLKDIRSVYSQSCFLHDRQQWADHLKKLSLSRSPGNSTSTSKIYDPKRRKKTPPNLSPEEGELMNSRTETTTEATIGNRILQTMGWNPGSGIGVEDTTNMAPPVCVRRPWRHSLNTTTQLTQHSTSKS